MVDDWIEYDVTDRLWHSVSLVIFQHLYGYLILGIYALISIFLGIEPTINFTIVDLSAFSSE